MRWRWAQGRSECVSAAGAVYPSPGLLVRAPFSGVRRANTVRWLIRQWPSWRRSVLM